MTKVLKMALLGRLQLSQDERPLSGLVSVKAQALLCYLAVTGRPHSRQALAGLLWGDLPEAAARRNLRGALLKLRQVLDPYLIADHQMLAFDRQQAYWLDVELFEAKTVRQPGQLTGRFDSLAPTPEQLREAVALYRGDFLEDFYILQAPAFEEWMMSHRRRLREAALNACYTLAIYYTEQGEYEPGIAYARHMVGLEPTREDGQQQLMLLLALNGQRSAALSQYEQCRHVLQSELSVEPSAETTALYERIRAGDIKRESEWLPTGKPAIRARSPAPERPAAELPAFIAGPPITHPRRFFGRERELRRLFNLLKHRPLQNAAIIGPRRSGKTSLLHYLRTITNTPVAQLRLGQRTDWLPQSEQYRWVFIDFQDPRLGERASLLHYLLFHMGLPVPETGDCDLEQFLDRVSAELHTPTVVLFDEIGVALARYPELDDSFWESLRSLATNQAGGNLAFILTSPEAPEQLARHSGFGSPFFNIFGYTATLGPFTEPEARDLIASSPLPFAADDIEWILAESGRWPILLQILCRECLLAYEDGLAHETTWRDEALRQIAPFCSLKAE